MKETDKADIEAGIRRLSECLCEIKTTLAWAELERYEAECVLAPSFRFDHMRGKDLIVQCGQFAKTFTELHEAVRRCEASGESSGRLSRHKGRLLDLHVEFLRLEVSGIFIKP